MTLPFHQSLRSSCSWKETLYIPAHGSESSPLPSGRKVVLAPAGMCPLARSKYPPNLSVASRSIPRRETPRSQTERTLPPGNLRGPPRSFTRSEGFSRKRIVRLAEIPSIHSKTNHSKRVAGRADTRTRIGSSTAATVSFLFGGITYAKSGPLLLGLSTKSSGGLP